LGWETCEIAGYHGCGEKAQVFETVLLRASEAREAVFCLLG
jgi:hypothetical protein